MTWISWVGMYSSTNFLPCSRCHSAVLPVFLSPRITIFTGGREEGRIRQTSHTQGKLSPRQGPSFFRTTAAWQLVSREAARAGARGARGDGACSVPLGPLLCPTPVPQEDLVAFPPGLMG